MKRRERTLQTLMREIDRVVAQHQNEYDRAWLLSAIIAECSLRLREFDAAVRTIAELETTSPERYIRWVEKRNKP